MTRDEIIAFANDAFNSLQEPPAGASLILIAVDTTTGGYQLRVSHMDATYLIGLLQRCSFTIDRIVHEAHIQDAAIGPEDVKGN